MKDVKAWENGQKSWDLTAESRRLNPELCNNYGRDPLTFKPETTMINNERLRQLEGPMSHGFPGTFWLQAGIAYGCGVYTAKQ